jgi:hypothetical protein
MSWRRSSLTLVFVGAAAALLGACAGSGVGIPRVVADAEPIPGGCPPSICPQHTPTQPPPPDEPPPEPTASAEPTKKAKPKPDQTSPGTTVPRTGPTPTATATTPGGPLPPVAPSRANARFAAFPFPSQPFDQAFPKEAPPAPDPLPLPPPTAMVALAAILAAGVAAATSVTMRRRARHPGSVVPRGGPA